MIHTIHRILWALITILIAYAMLDIPPRIGIIRSFVHTFGDYGAFAVVFFPATYYEILLRVSKRPANWIWSLLSTLFRGTIIYFGSMTIMFGVLVRGGRLLSPELWMYGVHAFALSILFASGVLVVWDLFIVDALIRVDRAKQLTHSRINRWKTK